MIGIVPSVAEWSVAIIEIVGILIIAGFAIYALMIGPVLLLRQGKADLIFRDIRQTLGRGILLGLEFLVAADIIQTVAIELTLESVLTLALVVAIRTFLSFALEVELTGHWPWQGKDHRQP